MVYVKAHQPKSPRGNSLSDFLLLCPLKTDCSPASKAYRSTEDPPRSEPQISEPGEVSLTPELFAAFLASLQEYKIEVRLVAGSWNDMQAWVRSGQTAYDIILSSETIYRLSSLPTLISLLRTACEHGHNVEGDNILSEQLSRLSLDSKAKALCFVAAKVVYFGVGGGIDWFVKAVELSGGRCGAVFDNPSGVSRRILQVVWNQSVEKSS